jgi:hypothetical protein
MLRERCAYSSGCAKVHLSDVDVLIFKSSNCKLAFDQEGRQTRRRMFLEQTQGFGGGGTAALEGDAQPPSLFELMMQERMAAGIKPALEYLVHTVTESYPQVSSALPVRYFEESYALLRFFMERYFLNRYDSLATEKFYGMKRVMFQAAEHTNQPAKTELLSDRARKQSLIFAVRECRVQCHIQVLTAC